MSASLFARSLHVIRPQCYGRSQLLNRGLTRRYHVEWKHTTDQSTRSISLTLKLAGLVGTGVSLHALKSPVVNCEPPPIIPTTQAPRGLPPPPESAVNLYELTFGSVCGICAGVFIKKGVKTIAFILGGVFVLLQYLGSASIIRVDWARIASRFENLFYRTEGDVRKPPNLASLWRWLIDFLTADFQPRASFIAGLALGIRIG